MKPDYWNQVMQRRILAQQRFEELSGQGCRMIHYTEFSCSVVESLDPTIIIFSGYNTNNNYYERAHLDPIRAYFLAPLCPTFTICGSFQLMAEAYGAEIGPIGKRLAETNVSVDPILPGDALSESGFCKVQVSSSSKGLFYQLGPEITVHQHHYWEVKSIPAGFLERGSSPLCKIQALEHQSLPLAGVQFHPEDFNTAHPDGEKLLQAFFQWANRFDKRAIQA
ncbi:MAG: gamma-glutamyl-gamma-aminobutyrate hydrolase family protein [Verrucomicrobiota bacterium]